VVSCGEENLLCYPGDPYHKENILKHLKGYKPKNAPTFAWPKELVEWYKNYEAEKRAQKR